MEVSNNIFLLRMRTVPRVVVCVDLGGTSLHGSSLDQELEDVLERAPGVSNRRPPIKTAEWVLRQFWQSFMEDKFDLENAIQKKAEFSYAIAVMDKIGGCEEENWVGSRYAASMWMYTEAVLCNGQNHM